MLERKCVIRSQKPLPASACDFFFLLLFKKKNNYNNFFFNWHFTHCGILSANECYRAANMYQLQ